MKVRRQKLSRVRPTRWEPGWVLGHQGLPSRAAQGETVEGALSPLGGPLGRDWLGEGEPGSQDTGEGLLGGGRSDHTRNAHPSLRHVAPVGGPRSLSKQVHPKALEAGPSGLGGKLPAPTCSSSISCVATRESSGPHSLKSRGHNAADTRRQRRSRGQRAWHTCAGQTLAATGQTRPQRPRFPQTA